MSLLVGVAVGVLVFVLGRSPAASAGSSVSSSPAAPYLAWSAGQHRAPDFRLTDQNGRGISIAAYHGRPVIVTFIDPLCRNFCPLEAQVLNTVVRQLPASQRPEILAVSVDIYGDAHADLVQDVSKWNLVPQWRWGVGQPAQLAAVWKRYEIGVQVTTKKLAGVTVHNITHVEAAYLIDGAGYKRALFVWPFSPQDVKQALRQL
jgi:cytochrome oxidase Cu insertion factor (SCO1/SenC/PrrC family)